jgi:hypothetical protein
MINLPISKLLYENIIMRPQLISTFRSEDKQRERYTSFQAKIRFN